MNLSEVSDEDLLREITRRSNLAPAPLSSTIGQGDGWKECTLADGPDHTAFVYVMADGPTMQREH